MKRTSLMAYLLTAAVVLVIWKLASLGMDSPVLPPPEEALKAFLIAARGRAFWGDFLISAYRVGVSIVLAWVLAFPAGVLMGFSPRLDLSLAPLVFMTYPIPKMVLLPVILLLCGLGDLSKIVLITLILFFQILLAVRDGVRAIDDKYFDSLRSMGGTNRDILREVVLPAALPHSFTALRISAGTSISVLFFAESFATTSGLGYLIMDAWGRAAYTDIFTGIIGMSLLGVILYEFFRELERRVCPWRELPGEMPPESSPVFGTLKTYLSMIKFSHTVFALPFAFASGVLVWRSTPLTPATVFWIVLAMVGARSAAMGFNRLADAALDARNPRTALRELPAGTISRSQAILFVGLSTALFVFAAALLSPMCFWLAFPVLALLLAYSYTKRFTWMSHLVLGLAIGLVPLAVWIAVAGAFSGRILMLCLALLTYIAGFDILYACQDIEFDRQAGLYSIPARFGVKKALAISSWLHVISLACLLSLFWFFALHPVYLVGVMVIAALFFLEHRLVHPEDLSRVNLAFFHVNSVVSVMVFMAVLLGELGRGW